MGCNYIHGPHLIYTIQRVCSFYHFIIIIVTTIIIIITILLISIHYTLRIQHFECCLSNEVKFYVIGFISYSSSSSTFDLVCFRVSFLRDSMTWVSIKKYQHELDSLRRCARLAIQRSDFFLFIHETCLQLNCLIYLSFSTTNCKRF